MYAGAVDGKDYGTMNRKLSFSLALLIVLGMVTGCAGAGQPSDQDSPPDNQGERGSPSQGDLAASSLDYDAEPNIPADVVNSLAGGNTGFAFDLYQALRDKPDNLFLSPYSISLALAMTYAGSAGETEGQMGETLNFSLPQDQLHGAFNQLTSTLLSRAELPEGDGFQLNITNALWGQRGHTFLDDYLDRLARHYNAGIHLVDFISASEEARQRINAWVAEQTEDKIKNIIPQGALTPDTRLVLTNAIYFNAAWASPFQEEATQPQTFTALDGSQNETLMMQQTGHYAYVNSDGLITVEIPYVGNQLSMLLMMPPLDEFQAFEASLDEDRLDQLLGGLEPTNIRLMLPVFEFESEFSLAQYLAALGMPVAFSDEADFSGIDGSQDLFLQHVLHKAFISVDEEGTEAAAATAIVVGTTSLGEEPIEVRFDHPFIFLIRDKETGTILFIGRLIQPSS
jgi:serpin B